MYNKIALIFGGVLLITASSMAQSYRSSLQAVTENDAYIDITKDRYYTNGLFINFDSALKSDSTIKKVLHINLAQKIFNPYYSTAPDPALHDRPFTAFLYGEIGVSKFQNKHLINYFGQLGINGHRALGETFQKFYHNLVGQNKVVGWDYALKADVGITVGASYLYNIWTAPTKWFDLFGAAQANIGSFATKASISPMLRIGKLNEMANSALFNSRVSTSGKRAPYELFFFAQPKLNCIAFDSSLQGGLFRNDKGPITFRPKPLVFSTQVGAIFAIQRWILNYTVTYTGKEVKDSPAPGYKYAAISAAYCFN